MKGTQKLELTEDNLKKALETFGLNKTFVQSNPFMKIVDKKDTLNKAETIELQKAGGEMLFKAMGLDIDSLKKAMEVSNTITEFNKTWGTKANTLVKGLKDMTDEVTSLKAELKSKDSLIKGFQDSLAELTGKVDTIGNLSQGKKSITADFIEKGFSTEEIKKAATGEFEHTFSLSKDLQKIKQVIEFNLDSELQKGNMSSPFVKHAQLFDAHKKLHPALLKSLNAIKVQITE